MKKPLWNVRTKLLLTLGLVVCPAVALVYFGFKHLESIERDHTVEAAIQGDFQQMLTIFDKRLSDRAYEMVDRVRPSFPSPLDKNVAEQLDNILAAHPWAVYAFIFDKAAGTVSRTQPAKIQNPECRAGGEKLQRVIQLWFSVEGEMLLKDLQKLQRDGELPYRGYSQLISRGEQQLYETTVFFPIAASKDRITIGGIVFDPEFLQQFFPNALNAIMTEHGAESKHDPHLHAAIMLHFGDSPPVAASSGWDGG